MSPPRPFTPEKILIVEWVDPDTTGGWVTLEEALSAEGARAVSVGIYLGETDDWLMLAMDWALDGEVNSRGKIYKPLIKKVKEIRFPAAFKPRRKREKKEVGEDG